MSAPRIIRTWLTNDAYGYPVRGRRRRVASGALLCLHISGNRRTAAMPALAGTRAEVAYSNRPGSTGPSAHDYVARDGTIFRCVKAADHAAWSNGDVRAPDRGQRGIRKMLRFMARGYNANEFFYREIEMTGHPSGYDPTRSQLESVAWQLARDSIATGLPIVPGETVLLHAHINSIDRRNCPFDRRRSHKLEQLCARAVELKAEMTAEPEPEPEPPPAEPPCGVLLEAAYGRIEYLESERDTWLATAGQVAQLMDPYVDDEGDDDGS
jgi:hypothetical protein